MNDLVKAGEFRAILEVGSSYGYSTLWLAEAAQAIGGRVTSLELHPGKIAAAREMLKSAGLADYVDFIEGDALASLDELPGTFDFVLIALWKDLYRSEEHTSELQSLMRISYAVFCLKNNKQHHSNDAN